MKEEVQVLQPDSTMEEKRVLIKLEVLLENLTEANIHLREDQSTLSRQPEVTLTTLHWTDADSKILQQL